jgi:RNA polymerase sigma-70 factor (ECF subfamily)
MRKAGTIFDGKIPIFRLFSGTIDEPEPLSLAPFMAEGVDFDSLVARHYEPLYHFAFSLTRDEADACDLTQQTFCIWAAKGHQLRDVSKVKTWLFTTLHREFLGTRRKQSRFPQVELEHASAELPVISPANVNQLDTAQLLDAMAQLDEIYRAPVALFYLQDYSYNEIAEVLEIPLGTVKSRLTRGLARLHQLLSDKIKS